MTETDRLTNPTPLVQAASQVDRYPIHRGATATVATITSVLRLGELGYRLQFVDLFSELVEGDLHARNCISTRVKAVAGRPWDVQPAVVEEGDERGQAIARFLASYCKAAIKRIPRWRAHASGLLWGIHTGVSAREIMWKRAAGGEVRVDHLRFIHGRRLGYDWEWNLVWSDWGESNTGTPLSNYPGKFLTFEPSTWDEYHTREGLGRSLVLWLGFKRFGVRDFLWFVERFGKPYPQSTWKTGRDVADEQDIATAKRLAKDIGRGSLAGVAHPDTITLAVSGNGSSAAGSGGSGENTPHKALVALCDEQVSQLVLGQAYTTNKGQSTGGLGGGSDVFADASRLIFVDDCLQLEEAIDHCLLWWIVALNFGRKNADQYCPHYHIEIEDQDDALKLAERFEKMSKVGQPIAVQYVADRMNWPLPKEGDGILTPTGEPATYQPPAAPQEDDAEPTEDSSDVTDTSSPDAGAESNP